MRNVGLSIIFFLSGFSAKFAAQPGTTSSLELLDSAVLVQSEGGMLLDYSNGLPWNPKRFKLTTEDGYVYYLTEGVGLEKVQDPFGNTLTYSKNGITHSAGLSVAFQRDGQGRITRITDPQGQSLQYTYNAQGELAAYTDPRGVTTASQDYDGQGRLTTVTDRLGHSTTYRYDDSGNVTAVWHGSPMCVGKQTVLSGTKIIATQMRNNLVISIGSPSVESF